MQIWAHSSHSYQISASRIPGSTEAKQYKHMISACEQGEHVKLTSYHARVDLDPPLHCILMGKDRSPELPQLCFGADF